jgi:hypothetical protein
MDVLSCKYFQISTGLGSTACYPAIFALAKMFGKAEPSWAGGMPPKDAKKTSSCLSFWCNRCGSLKLEHELQTGERCVWAKVQSVIL